MQQGRIADGFGHSQPMLIHQDWTFAQFRRPISKANIRSSAALASLPAPPNLLVFSRLADESVWAKVLNLGGFDVLLTPLEPEEVLRVAFSAWSRWERGSAASAAKESEAADRSRMSAFSD
jgi:hypothetical protein